MMNAALPTSPHLRLDCHVKEVGVNVEQTFLSALVHPFVCVNRNQAQFPGLSMSAERVRCTSAQTAILRKP